MEDVKVVLKGHDKEVEAEAGNDLNHFEKYFQDNMRSKNWLLSKMNDHHENLPEYGREKCYSCYIGSLEGQLVKSPEEKLVSDLFKNAPMDIAGLSKGDSKEKILPSIITYLKSKLSELKSKRAILEVLVESGEQGMTLKRSIDDYKKKNSCRKLELERLQQEKSKVIQSQSQLLSSEEENKLESAKHELEMKIISLKFDIYSTELAVYLETQKHDRKLDLMSSDLIKTNQDLCDTEELLKQCILAELEVQRERTESSKR